ncbi:hypothetical protein OIDMADRAFT_16841 [Oidiodendron maius Zn]|uniref:Uncharacterized protein n=1 Tax=Oidiodendron maius (strain Zn) TaxID=913774 RepID=A0A0C3HB75_OIDMZ|nr:hypothetical protein OIDMADRAFT_16841 [Oidiodendron maius Zn]
MGMVYGHWNNNSTPTLQSTTLDRSPFGKESHMRQITSVVEHPGSPSLHIPTHLAAADDFGRPT